MSAQVIAFPKAPESFLHGIPRSEIRASGARMAARIAELTGGAAMRLRSAHVIEFPPELMEEPLRTLAAEHLYFTGRVRYRRAWEDGRQIMRPPTRKWANEFGADMNPGPRVRKRYLREVAEAVGWLRREDEHTQQQRDEGMVAYVVCRQAWGAVSPALLILGRAAESRLAKLRSRSYSGNTPGAA